LNEEPEIPDILSGSQQITLNTSIQIELKSPQKKKAKKKNDDEGVSHY